MKYLFVLSVLALLLGCEAEVSHSGQEAKPSNFSVYSLGKSYPECDYRLVEYKAHGKLYVALHHTVYRTDGHESMVLLDTIPLTKGE